MLLTFVIVNKQGICKKKNMDNSLVLQVAIVLALFHATILKDGVQAKSVHSENNIKR